MWWSGFGITLTSGTYSAEKHQFTLEANVTNSGGIDTNLGSTRSLIAIRAAGQSLPLSSTTETIPRGATTRNGLTFANLPDDFALAGAELVLGHLDEHQAVLPLDGSAPTAEGVVVLPGGLTVANAHTRAAFKVTSIRLIPASCSGTNLVAIQYVPLSKKQLVLELIGDLASTSSSVGGVAVEAARATPQSGITAVATPELHEVLGASSPPRTDLHLCFPLPADTHGPVKVQFDTRLVGENFVPATSTLTLP